MIAALKTWRTSALAHLEWDRLHARRPPLGALPVWGAMALFIFAVTFPWGLTPLAVPVPGGASWQTPLLATGATPSRWIHALAFWALPWVLFERRLSYRGRSWQELEAKTTALIRLFGFALLWYPMMRLAVYGVSRLFYTGTPTHSLIEFVLLDTSRPILERYGFALLITGRFAVLTWVLVVCRLRVAQWAAVTMSTPLARLIAYSLPTILLTVMLIFVKTALFDPLIDADALVREGGIPALFFHFHVPWSLVAVALALIVSAVARTEARRRSLASADSHRA